MKITLDGLDGHHFTLRLPRDGGGEHVVSLHDTRNLRGLYAQDAERFGLDPVEADRVVGELAWVLTQGLLHLGGPAILHTPHFDIDIRRDDTMPSMTGVIRCDAFDVPVAHFRYDTLEVDGGMSFTALDARSDEQLGGWVLSTASVGASNVSLTLEVTHAHLDRCDMRGLRATLGPSQCLSLDALSLAGLSLRRDASTLSISSLELEGVRLTYAYDSDASLSLEVRRGTLTDVHGTHGRTSVRLPSLILEGLRYDPMGLSLARGCAETVSLSVHELSTGQAPSPSESEAPDAPSALDLPFLDGLEGRLEADVLVDVSLPVVASRAATHRFRVDFLDGVFDFKQLEKGLSRLEDAFIDFEVDAAGLYLEFDAVAVKRALVRWPLDAEGLRLARQNRVRLRTFAQPERVHPPSSSHSTGPSQIALRRIAVNHLHADLSVKGSSTLPLAGGVLRLGVDGDALSALRVSGALQHQPGARPPPTTVTVSWEGLNVGAEGLTFGAHRIDLARAAIARGTDGVLTFEGLTPSSLEVTLHSVEFTEFHRARIPPARCGGTSAAPAP